MLSCDNSQWDQTEQKTVCSNPYSLKCIDNFDPEVNLPSSEALSEYNQWRQMYGTDHLNYWDFPIFQAITLPVTDYSSPRNGSYLVGRRGRIFVADLANLFRHTGDPFVLSQLCRFAREIRENLVADHDGRGYPYIQYGGDFGSQFEGSDINWLEEALMQGTFGEMIIIFHENREKSPECAFEADYWLAFLDEIIIPKWYNRTTNNLIHTVGTLPDGTPYNLNNTTGWNHPDPNATGSANDVFLWGAPLGAVSPYGTFNLPHRITLSHTFAAEMVGMLALCKCFTDLGRTPKGNVSKTTAEYCNEFEAICNAYLGQFPPNANGTRKIYHDFNGRDANGNLWNGLVAGNTGISGQNYWYTQTLMTQLITTHYCRPDKFTDQVMTEFTRHLYGPDGIFIDQDTMWFNSSLSGTQELMSGRGFFLMYPWADDKQAFKDIIKSRVVSTSAHLIREYTNKTDGAHYTSCIMEEARNAFENPSPDKLFI